MNTEHEMPSGMHKDMYRCTSCGERTAIHPRTWRCGLCGGPLQFEAQHVFDRSKTSAHASPLWRYRQVFPLPTTVSPVTLGEGGTPLVAAPWLLGGAILKMDQLMPTGSFKDRGASVMMTGAAVWGARCCVEDSSGNAGAAVAAYGAAAGIACRILVPEATSPAKIRQIEAFGAVCVRVKGDRDATGRAAVEEARTRMYASHVWNPLFMHGVKTVAYEIAEQLNWTAPDWVVAPTGNGTLLLGLHLGFTELVRSGTIRLLPRLMAVQAMTCAPLAALLRNEAFTGGGRTRAEGIAVGRPPRLGEMAQAITDSDGMVVQVDEPAIVRAEKALAVKGVLVEPSAAVGVAAVQENASMFQKNQNVVVVLTGHGLKTLNG